MSAQSQKSGADFEQAFQRVLARFFLEAGYEVVHNRRQAAGTQGGCDLQFTVRPPGQAEELRLLFECKNLQTPVQLKEIVGKPFQAEIGWDHLDFWILVSPHTNLAKEPEGSWAALEHKFEFPLLRITPEEDVQSLIALDPEAYQIVYGRDPKPFDRATVLEHWKHWFEHHLSRAQYLQRFSRLLEVVDAEELRQRWTTQGEPLRDLALAFYRGTRPRWPEVVNDIDVRRQEPEDRVARVFGGDTRGVHLVRVHCEGGSGKSTFLRRVAFEASERGLVMFAPELPRATDAVQLAEETIQIARRRRGRRVMVAIDNGAAVLEQLIFLGQRLQDEAVDVVLVVAERLARWRDAEDDLKARGVSRIPATKLERLVLPVLDEHELRDLIKRLKYFRVSERVQDLSEEDLKGEFRERFRGDLLVTLHEVIAGQKVDDIVRGEEEEFRRQHRNFQFVYALTAAFHQFGVPVPETLLARMAGVRDGDLTSELGFRDVLKPSAEARSLTKVGSGWATRHEIVAKSIFRGLEREFGKRVLLGAVAKLDRENPDEVTAVMTVLVSPQTRREIWGLGSILFT